MELETGMINRKYSYGRLSFLIAFIYVGLGTIYALSFWLSLFHISNETLFAIVFYFFSPSSFISIGISFTNRNPTLLIIITQTVTFFIIWGIIYFFLSISRSDKKLSK